MTRGDECGCTIRRDCKKIGSGFGIGVAPVRGRLIIHTHAKPQLLLRHLRDDHRESANTRDQELLTLSGQGSRRHARRTRNSQLHPPCCASSGGSRTSTCAHSEAFKIASRRGRPRTPAYAAMRARVVLFPHVLLASTLPWTCARRCRDRDRDRDTRDR